MPFDQLVTRLPGGLTNVSATDIFANMRKPVVTGFHEQFLDFDSFATGDWVITKTGTGTTALTAGDGGLLLLTDTAGASDAIFLQWAGGSGAGLTSWLMEAGKKAFFKARFKGSDATLSAMVVGLQIIDTTPLDVTDGIYFLKSSGAATMDFIVRKNATTGSNSASAIATLANDTFVTVAFYYDGVDKVYYSVNDTILGSISGSSAFLPDAAIAFSFGVQNGEAVAKTMTIDYLYAAKER